MTTRRLIDVDITDRGDGKVPVWRAASATHEYESAPAAAFIGCIATRTANQTGIVTAVATMVDFTGTDELDTDAFHDPSTNPSRITIPTGRAGKYLLNAYVIWDSDGTGQRRLGFAKNGALIGGGTGQIEALNDTGFNQQNSSMVLALAEADYVEVSVLQNSGGNRTLTASAAALRFSATFLGT